MKLDPLWGCRQRPKTGKLTAEQAREMILNATPETAEEWARRFSVGAQYVREVLKGRYWRWIHQELKQQGLKP